MNTFGRCEPTWYYQLDEIVYQGLRNNMHVPLLALEYFRRKSRSFMYADEQEIFIEANNEPLMEIDIWCIADGVLTIGEAKISNRLDTIGKHENAALRKYKELSLSLGVNRFVLATADYWSAITLASAHAAFSDTDIEVASLNGDDLNSSAWK